MPELYSQITRQLWDYGHFPLIRGRGEHQIHPPNPAASGSGREALNEHFFFMASRGRLLLLCSAGSANLFQMSLSFQSCVSSLFFSWTWSLFSKLWGWGRYVYQSCQSQDVGQWVWKAQSLWIAAVLIQHFIHFKMIFNLSKNFPGCKGGTVNSLVALTDCVCWQRPGQLCLGGELHLRASPVPAFWASVSKVLTLLLPKQQKKILFTFPQRWEVQILHYFSRISRYLYFTWLCLLC